MNKLERLTHTFTFSDEELYTLRYTITQRMYRLEALIEEKKFLEPEDTTGISRLEDVLLTLECIHSMMFEGGDDECRR